jgi:hypothetical protein
MARIQVHTEEEIYTGLVDEDQYVATCVACAEVEKKNQSGETQLEWKFEFDWDGKSIQLMRFTPLAGRGVGFTRDILTGLGVAYDDADDMLGFDTDDCLQKQVLINVINEEYQGKVRNQIDSFTPIN